MVIRSGGAKKFTYSKTYQGGGLGDIEDKQQSLKIYQQNGKFMMLSEWIYTEK